MSPDFNAWLGQVPWGPIAAFAVVLLIWLVFSARGKKNRQALVAKLADGAKVFDVRSKQEFASGHYAGAQNIPVDTLASKLKGLGDKAGPVVVYCASGVRSAQAVSILKAAGFTDVTNAGGFASMPRS